MPTEWQHELRPSCRPDNGLTNVELISLSGGDCEPRRAVGIPVKARQLENRWPVSPSLVSVSASQQESHCSQLAFLSRLHLSRAPCPFGGAWLSPVQSGVKLQCQSGSSARMAVHLRSPRVSLLPSHPSIHASIHPETRGALPSESRFSPCCVIPGQGRLPPACEEYLQKLDQAALLTARPIYDHRQRTYRYRLTLHP